MASSTGRSPRGRPPDLAKRRAILTTAARLFLTHGYAGTSMRAVASAAGVSKPTLYSHFEHKEQLFQAIVRDRCDRYNRPERFARYPALEPAGALHAIGRGLLDLLLSPMALQLHRVMVGEAERRPKMARLFYEAGPERASGFLVEYLRRATALGRLAVDDAERAADEFQALVKGGKLHLRAALNLRPLPGANERDAHVAHAVSSFLAIHGAAKRAGSSRAARQV